MKIPSLEDTSDVYQHLPLPGGKVLRMAKPRLDLMPSAADRWMTCMASPRFVLENAHLIPADLSSKFSKEGNTAHEVAAAFLQNREPDPANCPTPIDAEMRMHGWEYAQYVESLKTGGVGMTKLIVEQKKELWFSPGRNAVVDAAVVNPESLHIIDYKYGAGVPVSPVENLQTTIYAYQIAAPLNLPLDFPIFSHIYQPRCRGNEGSPAHVWETIAGNIATIAGKIEAKARIIQINNEVKGNPLEFAPSEKACRWCPAKGFCPAREKDALDSFEPLALAEPPAPLPMPSALLPEQLAAVLRHKKKIVAWFNDAEEYAAARMLEGHDIPGYKMVRGRDGNRYWSDPQKAAKLLIDTTILKRNEVIEESVASVATIEKLLGKNKLSAEVTALIARPEGKPTIAPADDKRESVTIKAENEFEVLTDEKLDRLEDY